MATANCVYRDESTPRKAVLHLLANMVDAPPQSASSMARHFYDLQLVGLNNAPPRAGELIEQMLVTFLNRDRTDFSRIAFQSEIELCQTQPAIRIVTNCTDGFFETVYVEHGAANSPWRDGSVRRSTTLPGKGLYEIARAIRRAEEGIRRNVVPFTITHVDGQSI